MSTWKEQYRLRASELDADRQLDLVALCELLQETAGRHAASHDIDVFSLLDRKQSWVLSRLRLQRTGTATWREPLQVETWAAGTDKLLARRDYELSGPSGVVARAASAWLLIDVERRRPLRPFTVLEGFPTETTRRALDADLQRLPALEGGAAWQEITVQAADLDANQHVNHVRLVGWAVRASRQASARRGQPRSLAVDFIAEALLGDRLVVRGRGDADVDELVLVRDEDARVLVRVRLAWPS